jgi:mannosyltransferase OCH1-like enzyme
MSVVYPHLTQDIIHHSKGITVDFSKTVGIHVQHKYRNPESRAFILKLKDIYDTYNLAQCTPAQEPKIPKIIHQIWVGKRPLPETYKKLIQTWKDMHPDWEYKLWTDEEVKHLKLKNRKYYDKAYDMCEKANILRYELLEQYGGLYVDIDFECVKPFDIFHHCYDFYTGVSVSQALEILCNALIACTPHHPIMTHTIERIADKWYTEKSRFKRTGVLHYTQCFKESFESAPGRTIAFPTTYFYPINLRPKGPIETYPETWAVHYWAHVQGPHFYHTCKEKRDS